MPSDELNNMSENPPAAVLSAKVEKKRKRQAEEPAKREKTSTAPKDTKPSEGPSKKKQKKGRNTPQKQKQQKGKPQDTNKAEREYAVDESIAVMDGRLLADYFAQKAQKLNKELTAVELNDLCVSGMRRLLWSQFVFVLT